MKSIVAGLLVGAICISPLLAAEKPAERAAIRAAVKSIQKDPELARRVEALSDQKMFDEMRAIFVEHGAPSDLVFGDASGGGGSAMSTSYWECYLSHPPIDVGCKWIEEKKKKN